MGPAVSPLSGTFEQSAPFIVGGSDLPLGSTARRIAGAEHSEGPACSRVTPFAGRLTPFVFRALARFARQDPARLFDGPSLRSGPSYPMLSNAHPTFTQV